MTFDLHPTMPPLDSGSTQRIAILFFAAVTLFYLAFTPATIEGLGYNGENLAAADQVVTNIFNLARRQPLTPMTWARHGGLELLFELPFVLVSRVLFGPSVKWAGRVMALQPILATSLLCALLFFWMRRLSGSWCASYALALITAFATLFWPYAYIGLETTQSLCLLAAAYFALGRQPRRTWPEALLFALLCACTLGLKLTGLYLLPAMGYLGFCYFAAPISEPKARRIRQIVVSVLLIVVTFGLNYYLKSIYWSQFPGGSTEYFINALVDSPLTALAQAFSFFGSANKSLLLFAPVVALSLFRLPQAYRARPRLVIFALLVLCGLAGGYSLVTVWAEETWGPRYLHSAIAPLMICLAATHPLREPHGQKKLALAAALGLLINLPGALVAYTGLHLAATNSSRSTLTALQYDPAFNHVRFNYRLLGLWMAAKFGGATQPALWPPPQTWWFAKPADAAPDRTVDLRTWAAPQAVLLRGWTPAMNISLRQPMLLRLLLGGSLGLSLALFVWLNILLRRAEEPEPVRPFSTHA
ncbi:MAG: hypothetical protein ABIP14_13000 [Blastocatellia bacterium]